MTANPFPDMNPYPEDPTLWSDGHHTLISVLRRHLNRVLPEGYIRDPLPRITIPLLPDDPEVEVHLQPVLNKACEEGHYAQVVDYAADCPAPLPLPKLEWAYALLAQRGLRA